MPSLLSTLLLLSGLGSLVDAPAPAAAAPPASCVEGRWSIFDASNLATPVLRQHAQGRTPRLVSGHGVATVEFDAAGTLRGDTRPLVYDYRTRLAGRQISYRVEFTGGFDSTYEIVGDQVALGEGRLRGWVTMSVDGRRRARRPITVNIAGTYNLACGSNELLLTARSRAAAPLIFDR